MKTISRLSCILLLSGLGACASTSGAGNWGNASAGNGRAVRGAFEVQGSGSAGRAFASSRGDTNDSRQRDFGFDRGIPTPQPARDPVMAAPIPQPPIPSPMPNDGRSFARYPKSS